MKAADIIKALGGKGDSACCPLHNEERPSFTARDGSRGILVTCHTGCTRPDLIKELKVRKLWPVKEKRQQIPKEITDVYPYQRPDGTVIYESVRYHPKDFRARRPDGAGGFIYSLEGVSERYLFRAPALAKAISEGRTIILVEGEKDVINCATRLGIFATTNVGGAKKWLPAYVEQLKGARRVIIVPDNDVAGERHIFAVAPSLKSAGIPVRVLRLPGLPEKGDLTDWIEAGGTKEKFLELCKELQDWEPPKQIVIPGLSDTDIGNATRLIARHGANLRYTNERGWFAWNEKRWHASKSKAVLAAQDVACQIVDEQWAKKSQMTTRLYAMLDLASYSLLEALTMFDAQPDLINVKNGVLDLSTGQLKPHERELMMSKMIGTEYKPDAQCPQWLAFLERIMNGDEEMVSFLQRAVGYSLTGHTGEQCFFFCHGNGANGKSVFLETLQTLFCEYGANIRKDSLMSNNKMSGARNDLARLQGARFVTASETAEGERFDESLLKDLTGDDTITARFLFKEDFDFKPQLKLWMRGNYEPQIRGTDDGIWRRVWKVPFEVQIPENERNPNLLKELRQELPGILKWAVEGAIDWRFNGGLRAPDKLRQAREEYRQEMDLIGVFLSEACEFDPSNRYLSVLAGVLYERYRKWCQDNGHFAVSQSRLGRDLRKRGVETTRLGGRGNVIYIGIGVNEYE